MPAGWLLVSSVVLWEPCGQWALGSGAGLMHCVLRSDHCPCLQGGSWTAAQCCGSHVASGSFSCRCMHCLGLLGPLSSLLSPSLLFRIVLNPALGFSWAVPFSMSSCARVLQGERLNSTSCFRAVHLHLGTGVPWATRGDRDPGPSPAA